ncbi:hypothetical protein [Hymenobacter koreensis]|uniref:XRE family transcriptional regulator n=1 Tax=Hymenobacter koreensis TaxID=1084523 RepID=A0ABP8JL87_9BACT
MLRTPTSYSPTTAASVRRHFALSQAELARWLGLTTRQVIAVEAGKRRFSAAAEARLARLADLLPTAALPPAETPPAPPAPAGAAAQEAEQLRRRARRCRYLARRLQFQLDTLGLQDAALLRRCQGLAALRGALAAAPTPLPAADAAWLAGLEASTAAALAPRPGPLARAHLALRCRLLLAEADALDALRAAGA